MKYSNIREESLKIKVWQDFFAWFDTSDIPWNIDFCVKSKQVDLFSSTAPLVWAEAKTWDYDIPEMFTQLILTIWKAKTFEKTLPPAFLWAFDFKKIAFVEYLEIQDIFYENDFDWTVTPSNHSTKEFKKVYQRIENILKRKTWTFDFEKDEKDLKDFINTTIKNAKSNSKITINKNNFFPIYLKWVKYIKPQIDVNREELKKDNILDADFFLADLFVEDRNTVTVTDDETVKNDLFVIFDNGWYKIFKKNLEGAKFDATIPLKNKRQYELFWKTYKRPPAKMYQEYITQRRDLIVPQDIRERKWAFFTPRIWVEKSQEYMAEYFGENYQDEYYIRDCAAWTGNLLAWLTNKYNIYASTLDNADVIVMKDMIKNKSINLLENHVFQFDFLNDDFSKLPQSLQDIINDEEKRKKLIVYINPPYAEAASMHTVSKRWINKKDVAVTSKIYEKYMDQIWIWWRELFIQFLIRIYEEIPNCKIANFSTLKNLQSYNFQEFRRCFLAKLEKIFVVPWNTFDNVNGSFPIWFFIRNSEISEPFSWIEADIYDKNWNFLWNKNIITLPENHSINDWLITTRNRAWEEKIGFLSAKWSDFQNTNFIFIIDKKEQLPHPRWTQITTKNILECSIYLAVRHCIEAIRLNDRDQFLRPKDEREKDIEFQNDCLAFTLFHWQNRITSRETWVNHRIPFTENEVNARDKFASHFMTDFLKGREFSLEAKDVFEAWKKLWTYYHENCSNSDYLPNASLYEIREYFQWRNDKWKMNNKSTDEKYNELIWNLREKLKILWDKIAEKVYKYEFLKK